VSSMKAETGIVGLRLAYLTTRYPAISHSFIQREIQALRDLGAEIETISIHCPIPEDLFTAEDRTEAAKTIAIRSLPLRKVAMTHLRILAAHPRAYLATLRLGAGRPSNGGRLLAPLFHFAESVVVWDECRRRGVRHLHAHFTSPSADVASLAAHLGAGVSPGTLSWSFTAHGTDILSDSPLRLAAKVRQASLVICVSELGRAQLMRMVEEEHWDKVRTIRCGLDARWQAAASASAERLPSTRPDEAPLRILTVGRLEREKGHSILLDAVARVRGRGLAVTLEVVGGGSARERLVAKARDLGIQDYVTFAGKAGQDTIHEHYAAADLFCLPSLGEGVPVVLMEAMAMGLPVIASRVGGVPELVDDGESGKLVSPGDADELAVAIGNLVGDADTRRRMGVVGRERVLEGYNIERAANHLFGEFSRVIRGQTMSKAGGTDDDSGPRVSADAHR